MEPAHSDNLFAGALYEKGYALPSSMWGQLQEGHYIILERYGEQTAGGEVEVVSADASVLWVRLDRGLGRIAVCADEWTSVWLPKGFGL